MNRTKKKKIQKNKSAHNELTCKNETTIKEKMHENFKTILLQTTTTTLSATAQQQQQQQKQHQQI